MDLHNFSSSSVMSEQSTLPSQTSSSPMQSPLPQVKSNCLQAGFVSRFETKLAGIKKKHNQNKQLLVIMEFPDQEKRT